MKDRAISSRRVSLFEKYRNHWFCCTYHNEVIQFDDFDDVGRTGFSHDRHVPESSVEPSLLAKPKPMDSSTYAAIRLAKLAESVSRTRTGEN
ncbi:Px [Artemisia virus A]|uniref:Px n=1 Tax=Artemisia virus A TaxID=1133751 RepID=UPI0003D406E0|nr:Px [Artemisia virus A]